MPYSVQQAGSRFSVLLMPREDREYGRVVPDLWPVLTNSVSEIWSCDTQQPGSSWHRVLVTQLVRL